MYINLPICTILRVSYECKCHHVADIFLADMVLADMVVADIDIPCGPYGFLLWPIWLWPIWSVADMVAPLFSLLHSTTVHSTLRY